MICGSVTLSFILMVGSITAVNLHKKNELKDSIFEKAEIVMDKIDQHCHALNHSDNRVRRQAADNVRYILLRVLQDCDDDDNDDDDSPNTTPSPVEFVGDPCTSPQTVNLTGSWRKDDRGSNLRPNDGLYACDSDLQSNTIWFRFTSTGGVQLSNKCAPAYSCGSHGSFWSNAEMPSRVGEVKRVPIYGSWSGNCNWYTWPTANALTVKRCSSRAGDFVYKVQGTSSCFWSFCGMDLQAS